MPALLLALLAVQTSAPTCPVPAELHGWTTMVPVAAGPAPAVLRIGQGTRATLRAVASVRYPVTPEKPGAAGTSGGVFTFRVPAAGRYRVALGAGAWIDVVQNGRAVRSVAHAHGPDCSAVRKIVDFDLAPGTYALQVAGSPVPILPLMIARLR